MTKLRSMPRVAAIAMVVAGFTVILPGPPVEAAELKAQEVVGGWLNELPCPFTSARPSTATPTVVPFECVAGSTWDGDWVGHTRYRLVGTMDLVTGDFHGKVDETLVGVVGATRVPGTMHLVGTFAVDGATGTVVVWEQILGGTGAFAGSSGTVVFEGTVLAAGTGHGGYHGTWTHP